MDKELAKQIYESSIGKEFIEYLAKEADLLNKVDDIKPEEMQYMGIGRQLAYKKIIEILEPLLIYQNSGIINSRSDEYNT